MTKSQTNSKNITVFSYISHYGPVILLLCITSETGLYYSTNKPASLNDYTFVFLTVAPDARPRNVNVSSVSSAGLSVTWDPPRQNATHGEIHQYSIRYRKIDCNLASINLTEWMFKTVDGTMRYAEITNLARWSCYAVQIFPLNISNGKWSKEIQWRTSEDGKSNLFTLYTIENKCSKFFYFEFS